MRLFIQFAYNGTRYHGSQRQPNGLTVQEVLEGALTTLLRISVPLTFAGRTDAGVHAEMMIAHFDWQADLTPPITFTALSERLNRILPPDISVQAIWQVKDDLHARFSATQRTYEYRLSTIKNPFNHCLRTRIYQPLDYDAMNRAAEHLIGTHDFACFCKAHTDAKTTICTITHAKWTEEQNGATFRITANRFLRNMVRAIVGTLFEVGTHKLSPDDFQHVIASHNRQVAGQSAPAEGLYLVNIQYGELPLPLSVEHLG